MTNMLKVMADHRLDAIVHKAVEHQPTLIKDGVNPPYVDQKGAPHINTFLMFVPSIVVPAGFTRDDLPAGITFLGRPYDDARMIRLPMPTSRRRATAGYQPPRRRDACGERDPTRNHDARRQRCGLGQAGAWKQVAANILTCLLATFEPWSHRRRC